MDRELAIGLDLGGTNIKGILLDSDGNIYTNTDIPTEAGDGPESVARRMAGMISVLEQAAKKAGRKATGVGIGIPGLPDQGTGDVVFAPNLGWKNVPLLKLLTTTVTLPVILENDANTAALGEQWLGAGRGSANMIMITIGTGIGGGLILNGKLYTGANGSAGEIGHTVINPQGPPCSCGRRGCLETYTSATAMIRMAREAIEQGKKTCLTSKDKIEARDIVTAALQGDETSAGIVDFAAQYLGIGIANMINILNPDKVVVGGGVAGAGDILFEPLISSVRQWSLEANVDAVKIVPAQLGNNAGCIGAASLALKQKGTSDI